MRIILHLAPLLLCLTACTTVKYAKTTQSYLNKKVENTVSSPPALSEGYGESIWVLGPRRIILESDEIIGFLEFSRERGKHTRNNYRFRTYSKILRLEINGRGWVEEVKYYIKDPMGSYREEGGGIVIDKGSVTWIDAGFYKAKWSLGSYVYFDGERVKAVVGTEKDFERRMQAHATLSPPKTGNEP